MSRTARWTITEAHKAAISAANSGRKQSPEHIRKRMESSQATYLERRLQREAAKAALPMKPHGNKGKKHSPETIAKRVAALAETNRRKREEAGYIHKPKWRRPPKDLKPKRSHAEAMALRRGIPRPPEVRAKIGAGNKGKPRSPETREKWRQAKLGVKQSPLHIAKRVAAITGMRYSKSKHLSEDPIRSKSYQREYYLKHRQTKLEYRRKHYQESKQQKEEFELAA